MRKLLSLFLTAAMLVSLSAVSAENANEPTSESVTGGKKSIEYSAVNRITDNRTMSGRIESVGSDENAILVLSGNTAIRDAQIISSGEAGTGGSDALSYGIDACVLVTNGTVDIIYSAITTRSNGGTGIFAYGAGVATASDCEIDTSGSASCGIRTGAGGTLFASGLSVLTYGEISSAIGNGGGPMLINGGSYITYGEQSPAVEVRGETTVNSASLVANQSEALCLEGPNTVRLNGCVLSGNMQDLENSGLSRAVSIYQTGTANREGDPAVYEMSGGTLDCENGDVFYTTNTNSVITLDNVIILKSDDACLLRCTGNDGTDGNWGEPGENGAECVFTAVNQTLSGNIIYDSISEVQLYLTENSTYTGAVTQNEPAEADSGDGRCDVYIDDSSCWIVCGSGRIGTLSCSGIILDNEGKTVSIVGSDGASYVEGTGSYTLTVSDYNTAADMSGANNIDSY